MSLCAAAGCQPGYIKPPVPYDSASSYFDKAHIQYAVDASKLQVPVSVARIEGQLVSYQQVPSTVQHGGTIGNLEIEYPHPQGRQGFALARVKIESKFSADGTAPSLTSQIPIVGRWVQPPTQVQEIWELDIPRDQLDHAVASLNQKRFFERSTGGTGPVALETSIDGHAMNKTWESVPELDQLMVAVRTYGRLVSYQRTPTTDKMAGPPPASIEAYRAYAARDIGYGASADRYFSRGDTLPGVTANPAVGYTPPATNSVAAQSNLQQRVTQLPSARTAGRR